MHPPRTSGPPLEVDDQELALVAGGLRIIALRALGDADAAQEIVQEALARALQAIGQGKLRDRSRLGAFVRGIARHVIADELRRRGRLAELSAELPDAAARGDALDALVRREDEAAVRSALAELSPSDQHIIRLSFVDGLSPSEVARETRERPDRIRKRKSRALERLRQAFLRARGGAARHENDASPTVLKIDGAAARAAGENGD